MLFEAARPTYVVGVLGALAMTAGCAWAFVARQPLAAGGALAAGLVIVPLIYRRRMR